MALNQLYILLGAYANRRVGHKANFEFQLYERNLVVNWGPLFSGTGSHSVARASRDGTYYIVKTGFKLTVILLPQLLGARITGVSQHIPCSCFNLCIIKDIYLFVCSFVF